MVLIFVMYVMKLRIHHILQCHFVIQKIQSTSKEEAGGLLLNMTISLDTGLLSGHCSSLPKRSEKESTHTNRKKFSKNHFIHLSLYRGYKRMLVSKKVRMQTCILFNMI